MLDLPFLRDGRPTASATSTPMPPPATASAALAFRNALDRLRQPEPTEAGPAQLQGARAETGTQDAEDGAADAAEGTG
ncbi:MAG: hypothetical protein WBA67_12585, partial [Jannaschia sp.]